MNLGEIIQLALNFSSQEQGEIAENGSAYTRLWERDKATLHYTPQFHHGKDIEKMIEDFSEKLKGEDNAE